MPTHKKDWNAILQEYSDDDYEDTYDTLNVMSVQRNAHRCAELLHSMLPNLSQHDVRAPPMGMNDSDIIRNAFGRTVHAASRHSRASREGPPPASPPPPAVPHRPSPLASTSSARCSPHVARPSSAPRFPDSQSPGEHIRLQAHLLRAPQRTLTKTKGKWRGVVGRPPSYSPSHITCVRKQHRIHLTVFVSAGATTSTSSDSPIHRDTGHYELVEFYVLLRGKTRDPPLDTCGL